MKVMLAALFAWAAPAAAQEPTSTPSPTPAATPSPTPSATPSPTPGATPSPTPGAIPSPTPGATPAPTPSPTPAPAQTPSAAPVQAAEPATPALAEEPLFKEYKGVTLGMSLEEVRGKLGQPKEKDKSQDIFIFSDAERARVYYDGAGKANAIVITYVGKSSGAPEPKSVIGIDIAPTESGTLYKLVTYPRAGYSIAYSRTAGDEPLTMITMQKVATTSQ